MWIYSYLSSLTVTSLFIYTIDLCGSSAASLTDLPQNDVYNNRVDEVPLDKPSDEKLRELSLLSWQTLENNNRDTYVPKVFNKKGKKLIQGPRGPPGPQGPPGAMVTKDDMMKMFKKMVKESAAERARDIILSQCPTCEVEDIDAQLLSSFYPGVKDRIKTINRAPVAFATQLLQDHTIYPNSSKQINSFRLSGSQFGSIQGVEADLGMDGKFQAQKSGIYQFTVTLNFRTKRRVPSTKNKKNYIEVKICPNDMCDEKLYKNLIVPTYRHSMESRQRYFTVQFSALLQLKKKDFVTINVENLATRVLKVLKGSVMTGIMLSTS